MKRLVVFSHGEIRHVCLTDRGHLETRRVVQTIRSYLFPGTVHLLHANASRYHAAASHLIAVAPHIVRTQHRSAYCRGRSDQEELLRDAAGLSVDIVVVCTEPIALFDLAMLTLLEWWPDTVLTQEHTDALRCLPPACAVVVDRGHPSSPRLSLVRDGHVTPLISS